MASCAVEPVAFVKDTFWHLAEPEASLFARPRCYSDPEVFVGCDDKDDESSCSTRLLSDSSESSSVANTAESVRSTTSESSSDIEASHVDRYVFMSALSTMPSFGFEPLAVPSPKQQAEGKRRRRVRSKRSTPVETEVTELTTIMLKNLPNNLTRAALQKIFDEAGFQRLYDFLYLPIDFDSDANLGYAFVNMTDGDAGQSFWQAFDGFSAWGGDRASTKVLHLEWSQLQGLEAHVQRYRNSPLLHDSMRDERRPILLSDGERIAFPPPTCSVKVPRRKGRH